MRPKYAKLNIARLLSSLLAAVLIMTLLAVLLAPSALADETQPEDDYEILPDYDPYEEKIDWENVETSGSCGEKLTWSYNTGTLTISGSGKMSDFYYPNMAPWYPLRTVIHRVVFPEKMTYVGKLAFYGCTKIKTISLPDKVGKIGGYAFAECEQLEAVSLGKSLDTIGPAAFYACVNLEAIRFPYSLTRIDYQAFYRCESLKTITLPRNVTKLGSSVFAYCKNLIRAEISARVGSLPEWTFYGCERLTVVVLPNTVSELENYALKKCDDLSTIYFNGTPKQKQKLQNEIVVDVPLFEQIGHISDDTPLLATQVNQFTNNEDGTVTNQSLSVREDDNMTFVSKIEHKHDENTVIGGTYSADITITMQNQDAWDTAIETIKNALQTMNNQYSQMNTELDQVKVTVYLSTEETVDKAFVSAMAGRDVKMTVVTQNGSEYRMDCSDLKKEELSGDYNYSYSVDSATQESQEALGTDNCYKVTFDESAKINAEVVIPLPENKGNSNAFLYQVERDGTHTRLQAVAVDNDGNAHFYLGAVDKDTEYVIGVNVPNETTDDVIIPDELFPSYGSTENAIVRLQKIDYVVTGRKSSWGLGAMQVTWIMLAVIAVCIVVVGVIMAVWNKRRLERGYVPEIDDGAEEM